MTHPTADPLEDLYLLPDLLGHIPAPVLDMLEGCLAGRSAAWLAEQIAEVTR
jgi:hypothetical protein